MSSLRKYHKQLCARWKSSGMDGMPGPWRQVPGPFVGGVHSAGLDPDGKYLLTISELGRGLFDCLTGEKIARDYDADESAWMDRVKLTAMGIGALDGQQLRIAGRFIGGGLPTLTRDGWSVTRAQLNFGSECVWAEAPDDRGGFFGAGTFYKLWQMDHPFACGFSESGTTLVVTCGNVIRLWVREVS